MIRDEDIREKLKEIDEHIRKEYIESHPKQERDWAQYQMIPGPIGPVRDKLRMRSV